MSELANSRSEPGDADHELFDLEALRANGLVWALNRHVLHPLGLAIGLFYPGEAEDPEHDDRLPTGWQIARAFDGLWTFDPDLDAAGQARYLVFLDYIAARPALDGGTPKEPT